jgi:chorismate-pyruvate lyase
MGEGGRNQSAAVSDHNTARPPGPPGGAFWDAWSPFQRTLVSTDGTVTRTLEAFTGEAIKCVKLDQAFGRVDAEPADAEALEAGPGNTAIRRAVLLRGRRSLCNYVHACSTVLVERVPVTMVYAMIYTSKPVGVLLAEDRVETTREILDAGEEPAGMHAKYFGLEPDDMMIWRNYRIVVGRLPALLITERFAASLFATEMVGGGLPGWHAGRQ